jgi:hypothetical protein
MAAVQGDPRGMQSLHGWLTLLWLAFAVPVLLTDLKNSVPLLVFISIYANVAGHWASWQASRVEVRQEEAGQ